MNVSIENVSCDTIRSTCDFASSHSECSIGTSLFDGSNFDSPSDCEDTAYGLDLIKEQQILFKRVQDYLKAEDVYDASIAHKTVVPNQKKDASDDVWERAKTLLAANGDLIPEPDNDKRHTVNVVPRPPIHASIDLSRVVLLSPDQYSTQRSHTTIATTTDEMIEDLMASCTRGQIEASRSSKNKRRSPSSTRGTTSSLVALNDFSESSARSRNDPGDSSTAASVGSREADFDAAPQSSTMLDMNEAIALSSAPRLVVDSKLSLQIIHVNKAFLDLTGLTRMESVVGEKLKSILYFEGDIDWTDLDPQGLQTKARILVGNRRKGQLKLQPIMDQCKRRRLSDGRMEYLVSHVLVEFLQCGPLADADVGHDLSKGKGFVEVWTKDDETNSSSGLSVGTIG